MLLDLSIIFAQTDH